MYRLERAFGIFYFSVLTGGMTAYGWARSYFFLGEWLGFSGEIFDCLGVFFTCLAALAGLRAGFHIGVALRRDL